MQNEQTPAAGPNGYLVKDFADGWYWTPNAALECTDGAPVWNVAEARYETERRPHVASPASSSSVVQGDAGGVERSQWLWRIPGYGWVLAEREDDVVREVRQNGAWVKTEIVDLAALRPQPSGETRGFDALEAVATPRSATMTDIDLDKLEALADAATQGPWTYEGVGFTDDGGEYREVTSPAEIIFGEWSGPSEENAAFIATANPATIKSLIASAREAAAEIESLVAALASLVDRDLTYDGPCIVIPTKNHGEAISLIASARTALEGASDDC